MVSGDLLSLQLLYLDECPGFQAFCVSKVRNLERLVMEITHQYPPELTSLLIDAIQKICRSKQDVLDFFVGAGVSPGDLSDLHEAVQRNRQAIYKHEIVRRVLRRVNQHGEKALRTRREILKRVTEFDDFSVCWESDQLEAEGLVSKIQKLVKMKDTVTKISQEQSRLHDDRRQAGRDQAARKQKKLAEIANVRDRLLPLYAMNSKPNERGKLLEGVLNRLFKVYGVSVREDFTVRMDDGRGVGEQIDGAIELAGDVYLVEMKWLNTNVGRGDVAQHLTRVYSRGDVRGMIIVEPSYTSPAIDEVKRALPKKTVVLVRLEELVRLLLREGDLCHLLDKKVKAAMIDRNPFLELLEG